MLLQEHPKRTFGNEVWDQEWPQPEVWEILALAQHHWVETRLLDFTENPLIAAFWAAHQSWERQKEGVKTSEEPYIAVWVVDLRFIRAVSKVKGRYQERVAIVRVPSNSNAYLHAQAGVFLTDAGANDAMNVSDVLSLEEVIVDRARFWSNGDRLQKRGIDRVWFGEVPIANVNLQSTQVISLLKELATRSVTKGSLMPNLDRVVEALEFDKEIAKAK